SKTSLTSGSSRVANYNTPLITCNLRPYAAPRRLFFVVPHLLRNLGNRQSHADIPESVRPMVILLQRLLRWIQLVHIIFATIPPIRPHLLNEPAAVTHNKEP